ncbi:MAG: hypothetical protein ACKVOH_00430 [Chlamydiales bacterium]
MTDPIVGDRDVRSENPPAIGGKGDLKESEGSLLSQICQRRGYVAGRFTPKLRDSYESLAPLYVAQAQCSAALARVDSNTVDHLMKVMLDTSFVTNSQIGTENISGCYTSADVRTLPNDNVIQQLRDAICDFNSTASRPAGSFAREQPHTAALLDSSEKGRIETAQLEIRKTSPFIWGTGSTQYRVTRDLLLLKADFIEKRGRA